MNKKLWEIKSLLQEFLQKKKNKDWIEPDDKRYTKILTKYEKQLSKHWRKTRNAYLAKLKSKFLDIDEDPEDYIDPSYDTSDYIDQALLILALAFGEGVIVGYREIQNRGLTVDIPDNPNEFLDIAKEVKNYSWAALSYEQQQMDDIFEEYNNSEDARAQIKKWFDSNEHRLTDLMLGGLVWYAINFGFTKASITASSDSEAPLLLYWLTEKDGKVCDDCKKLEAGNPYSKDNPLPTLPGGGKTVCGSRCRCVIDTEKRKL